MYRSIFGAIVLALAVSPTLTGTALAEDLLRTQSLPMTSSSSLGLIQGETSQEFTAMFTAPPSSEPDPYNDLLLLQRPGQPGRRPPPKYFPAHAESNIAANFRCDPFEGPEADVSVTGERSRFPIECGLKHPGGRWIWPFRYDNPHTGLWTRLVIASENDTWTTVKEIGHAVPGSTELGLIKTSRVRRREYTCRVGVNCIADYSCWVNKGDLPEPVAEDLKNRSNEVDLPALFCPGGEGPNAPRKSLPFIHFKSIASPFVEVTKFTRVIEKIEEPFAVVEWPTKESVCEEAMREDYLEGRNLYSVREAADNLCGAALETLQKETPNFKVNPLCCTEKLAPNPLLAVPVPQG